MEEVVNFWKEASPGFLKSGPSGKQSKQGLLNRDLKRGERFVLLGPSHGEEGRELRG